jgi:hypothetical protein
MALAAADTDFEILAELEAEFASIPRCEHSQHHHGRSGHSDAEERYYMVLVWPHCGTAAPMVMCASYIDHMITNDSSVRCIGCGKGGFPARDAYRVLGTF